VSSCSSNRGPWWRPYVTATSRPASPQGQPSAPHSQYRPLSHLRRALSPGVSSHGCQGHLTVIRTHGREPRQHTWPSGHGAIGRFGLARPKAPRSVRLGGTRGCLWPQRPAQDQPGGLLPRFRRCRRRRRNRSQDPASSVAFGAGHASMPRPHRRIGNRSVLPGPICIGPSHALR